MTRTHWVPPILFLGAALLAALLRLVPERPARLELGPCPHPVAERERGLLRVRCEASPSAASATLPATARLLLGLRVELNGASESELRALPRIGPVLSRRIVEARRASGGFCSLDELTRVRGLGRATVRRLEPLVSVEGRAGCGGADRR